MVRCKLLLVSVLLFTNSTAPARDERPAARAPVRVVQGRVTDERGTSIAGALVMLGPADGPRQFTQEATARTDVAGRYRIALSETHSEWFKLRTRILAEGFRAVETTVVAESENATADVALPAEAWKTNRVRFVDPAGSPASGVEVTCYLPKRVLWSRLVTDLEGRCDIKMARGQWITLEVKSQSVRPVTLALRNVEGDPSTITVSLHPPIKGCVRDPQGRPMDGVVVGWAVTDEHGARRMEPHPFESEVATTDSEGRFSLAPGDLVTPHEIPRPGDFVPPETICFADRRFKCFAFRFVDLSRPVERLDVTLGAGRTVRIPVRWGSAPATQNAFANLTISLTPDVDHPSFRSRVFWKALSEVTQPVLETTEVTLPQGDYKFAVISIDGKTHEILGNAEQAVQVRAGSEVLELPPLRIEPTFHQRMIGKTAPEIEATDLDTSRPVRLSDLRGKVVVLDFWGYWCGPCVVSMRYLIELHRRFEHQPLAIVALHDQSVQSRADYDRRIAYVRKELWSDRDLPFRVLLDRPDPSKAPDRHAEGTGLTCKRYRIESFPELFVIDQQSKIVGVVRHSEHDRLESLVRTLLAKSEPPRPN